jgi:transposase
MNRRKVRNYDNEFKLNAVNLCLGNNLSYKQISKELGIPDSTLRGWVESYQRDGKEAFPGKGKLKPSEVELANLRKELRIVQEERDILKKALGIFSLVSK